MWYIVPVGIAVILIVASTIIAVRTERTFKSLDEMLDAAADGTFSESSFTEKKLSRLESKMYRFLASGKISLRQINTEKDMIKTLIADISHQTKTPIANILLYSQLLSESKELNGRDRTLAVQIENQTEKLSFLISSLIKVSRLENGIVAVNPRCNSIKELLESVDLASIADKRGVRLNIQSTAELSAVFDFKWTLEAITNIIDNALKYTPCGGEVSVSARDYEMFVCIDVADNGIGISEEETAKIFTRFYRSAEVSDEQGVGIGLYLSREIVSKEGGYIKVSSKINKGSTFSVFLPKTANLSKV